MLARASFQPHAASRFVLDNPGLIRALGKLSYSQQHKVLVGGTWLETWLRWPLKTLHLTDRLTETFARVDPDGRRFGLTPPVQRRFRDYQLLFDIPDLAVLLMNIDDPQFRRRAISVSNREVLDAEKARGAGAIVVGFRLGPYPLTPLALAGLGHSVSMIVGGEPLAEAGRALGEQYAPRLSRRIRYVDSLDRSVLTQARAALDDGHIVSTLLELSPYQYAKTTPVSFLGWETSAAYGLPYLAAATQRSIIPLVMTRSAGPRFRMKFLEPIPPPANGRSAILETTQALWTALERQVLKYPDQWIGWTRLQSHLGIDVTTPPSTKVLQ